MLTPVIFIALIPLLPTGTGTKHACLPNSQFVLNGQMCFCDSQGWWNATNCRTITRRTCTPGQIIWQGCNQCICQENEQLICNNAACYGDTSSEDTFHKSVLIPSNSDMPDRTPKDTNAWCTPYKSYYVNCSICVCSASGKTADAHCATDNSCQKLPPSTSDFLTYVNKNICIPKVMYLFSCLHCLCSDGGYFILDQCIETCRRPQQGDITRRCISKTFYMKDCNICWCPDDGVADDKLCTKLVCKKDSKLKSLDTLKVASEKCNTNVFLKPKCFYCACDANGLLNEKACLQSDCLKTKYFKYDISTTTCSPGEMVPICQECFCLKGGITNQSYCSNVCSYQSKLIVLEKVLKDNRDNNELLDRDKIKRTSENDNCQPNSMYLDHSRYCLCPENGSTNFKLCTSIVEESYPIKQNLSVILPINNSLTASCEPNSFVEIDCNTCYCGKNGRIDPKWCTNDDCDAKRIIQNGQNTLRGPSINQLHFNDTCVPGSVMRWECNFCICPLSGKTKNRACTTNTCSENQAVYEEKFVCEPLAYYLVDCNVCLCPRDGIKNVEKCTKKICEKPILRSDSCTPGQLFSNECNVCVCPPNGNKADRVCTKHKCSDLEIPWKKIFRLSQSLLAGKSIKESSPPKQDLDFCFSGEEFEIGCKICVCPDVGMKSHASCSEIVCDKKVAQDNNGLEDTNTDVSKTRSSEKSLVRRKRHRSHHRHHKQEPEPLSQPVFEKDTECFTFNLTNSSERKECTPGSTYIIRCRQCICPYVGNINYFCRALPQGKYCEQAFPNFNYLPMGRRIEEDEDASNSSDTRSPQAIRHDHTNYRCTKPGRVLDECYICECEQDGVLVEEHCFKSDAEKCDSAKPTFLDTVNKIVILPL